MEAAVEELRKALAADPENADAHHMLGIIALDQGHDYIQQGETADCLSGQDGELVRQDAQRKFREAEQYFRRAVAMRPEFPIAWNNLAVTALQLEDWPAAASAAERAIKDSTYSEPEMARANLGWAYLQMKDTQSAWKELHEAVSRAPGSAWAATAWPRSTSSGGTWSRRRRTSTRSSMTPRCPIQEAYLLGGLVHQRGATRERARALFQRCADMAPRSCAAGECRRYAVADALRTRRMAGRQASASLLREAREKRGLTPGRAGAAPPGSPSRRCEALEAGRLDGLPPEVYAKGFIRSVTPGGGHPRGRAAGPLRAGAGRPASGRRGRRGRAAEPRGAGPAETRRRRRQMVVAAGVAAWPSCCCLTWALFRRG